MYAGIPPEVAIQQRQHLDYENPNEQKNPKQLLGVSLSHSKECFSLWDLKAHASLSRAIGCRQRRFLYRNWS